MVFVWVGTSTHHAAFVSQDELDPDKTRFKDGDAAAVLRVNR